MNKHFIFTSGRSGSNYLSNTLNISKKCVNYGEVLGEWTVPYKWIYKNFFKNFKINGRTERELFKAIRSRALQTESEIRPRSRSRSYIDFNCSRISCLNIKLFLKILRS